MDVKSIEIKPTKISNSATREEGIKEVEQVTSDGPRVHSFVDPLFNDTHGRVVKYFIESPSSDVETAQSFDFPLITLKRISKRFYDLVSFALLEVIEKEYNPKVISFQQFPMLKATDPNFIPECFRSNFLKVLILYDCAMNNSDKEACKAFITIFNQCVRNLLMLFGKNQFKFCVEGKENEISFYLLGLPNYDRFQIHDYLFMKFLEKYISSGTCIKLMNDASQIKEGDSNESLHQFNTILQFLENNHSKTGVTDLVESIMDQLFNPEHSFIVDKKIKIEPFQKYLSTKFLERYITTEEFKSYIFCPFADIDSGQDLCTKIIDFIKKNLSMPYVQKFSEQLIHQLSSDSWLFQEETNTNTNLCMLFLARMVEEGLFENEKMRQYIFPKILLLVKNEVHLDLDILHNILYILQYTDFIDCFSIEHVEQILNQLISLIYITDADFNGGISHAINLIVRLGERNLINQESFDVLKKPVMEKLNNTQDETINCDVIFFISLFYKQYLTFGEVDRVIPKILPYLDCKKDHVKEETFLLLESHVTSPNIANTQHGYALISDWIGRLSSSMDDFKARIFRLCIILIEKKIVIDTEKMFQLKKISIQYLEDSSELVRETAAKLLTLLATPEEQQQIVVKLLLESCIKDCQQMSGVFLGFDPNLLMAYFKNLNGHKEQLTGQVIETIQNSIQGKK